MNKYYYIVNRDGTSYDNITPFKKNSNYAEALDWIDNDCLIDGYALHVVSENPAKILLHARHNYPIAYEVIPIDLRPARTGVSRCRAIKKVRTLSDEEFADFFIKTIYLEKADLAITINHIQCLNKCIEMGMLPSYRGANWAAGHGYLKCLNACIKTGVLPNYSGAEQACENGHTNCANRCIQLGLLSKNIVFG